MRRRSRPIRPLSPLSELVKSKHQKTLSESTRLSDFSILILCVFESFGNVTKAFFDRQCQYATMKKFCEFKSSNYQEITQAYRF